MTTVAANFDCADIYQEHGYLVRLTRGRDARVQVFKVFGRLPTDREPQWAPETVMRCEAPRDVWDVVSSEARAEFNRRLKLEEKPAGAGARTIRRCNACSARNCLFFCGRWKRRT